jgi:protein-disulfide isomerase
VIRRNKSLRGASPRGGRLLRLSLVIGCLASLGVYALVSYADNGPAAKSTAAGKAAPAKPAKAAEVTSAPVKTYGSKSAPIELEVFGDYECPSCGAFYETTLRQMINSDVAAGKVYIVHRDFPLQMHKYGYEAARWANAAASIGKFAEAEAALYDNQNYWAESGNIEKYMANALSATDMKRVKALMTGCDANVAPGSHSCPFDAFIEQDRALGNQIPVQATPTFVIYHKGQKFPAGQGVVSYTVLKQFFDQLLKQ